MATDTLKDLIPASKSVSKEPKLSKQLNEEKTKNASDRESR